MSFFSSLTSLETEARKMNFFFITLSFEIELLNREDGFRLLFAQRNPLGNWKDVLGLNVGSIEMG